MATRFYLPSTTGDTPISPAISGGWGATGNLRRYNTSPIRSGTAFSNQRSASISTTGYLFVSQFISPPLASQTISGIASGVSGVIWSYAQNTGFNVSTAICIRVVNAGGTGVGTVLPITSGTLAFTTTGTNHNIPATQTISTVNVSPGYYLVIELGARHNTAVASASTTYRYGDSSTSGDLLYNQSGTVSGHNPWIEFKQDLLFATGVTTWNPLLSCGFFMD